MSDTVESKQEVEIQQETNGYQLLSNFDNIDEHSTAFRPKTQPKTDKKRIKLQTVIKVLNKILWGSTGRPPSYCGDCYPKHKQENTSTQSDVLEDQPLWRRILWRRSVPSPTILTPYILLSTLMSVSLLLYNAIIHGGWTYGYATSIVCTCIILIQMFVTCFRDSYLRRSLLFAVILSSFSVLSDFISIKFNGGLVYHKGGPFVLYTPAYVVIGTVFSTLQLCAVLETFVAFVGDGLFGLMVTSCLSATLQGVLNLCAKDANLWVYTNASGLFKGTLPFYLIFTHFIFGASLVIHMRLSQKFHFILVALPAFLCGITYCVTLLICILLFGPNTTISKWGQHQVSVNNNMDFYKGGFFA
ncbi:thiol:disulfide interchange protein [Acrasis kona]|uniref:Thiol:disulfide interchange protein n=1 Tax=Acrasis kona TaxID=1008807 RepID=A0AAW2ZKH6_9EUKA